MKNTFIEIILVILLTLLIVAGEVFLLTFLWNLIIPSIFNVGKITFWQALGLCIIIDILGFFIGRKE